MPSHFFFRLGSEDGLESMFFDFLPGFAEYYWDSYMEYTDVSSDEVTMIENLQSKGRDALIVSSPEESALIDKVVSSFLGEFCSSYKIPERAKYFSKKPGKEVGYFTNSGRDVVAKRAISKLGSPILRAHWDFVMDGRSLARGLSEYRFTKSSDGYRCGYWPYAHLDEIHAGFVSVLDQLNLRETEGREDAKYVLSAALNAVEEGLSKGLGLVFDG